MSSQTFSHLSVLIQNAISRTTFSILLTHGLATKCKLIEWSSGVKQAGILLLAAGQSFLEHLGKDHNSSLGNSAGTYEYSNDRLNHCMATATCALLELAIQKGTCPDISVK